MRLPRSFKTDESFLEKIAMGAVGTMRTFQDLERQGHKPLELERGSMSFKIWKAIKIKRVRVPDILCLGCGRRIESRAKTKVEISMSHSEARPDRGWDYGLEDRDFVALVTCQRSGEGPLDWIAGRLVQYVAVNGLRRAWRKKLVKTVAPKGAQEGFEARVTWPSRTASAPGTVEEIGEQSLRFRRDSDNRAISLRLTSGKSRLEPFVRAGEHVQEGQILASVAAVTGSFPCDSGAAAETYTSLAGSKSLTDRYTAAKALGRFPGEDATAALVGLLQDSKEHIYVRVDAAAGLMRRQNPAGTQFLRETLADDYLENRLEATIVLGEVSGEEAAGLLIEALRDQSQHPEIRAGAAWSLGEIGLADALPVLIDSFDAIEMPIRIEAARALAKVGRTHFAKLLEAFPRSTPDQRPGMAWAMSKAGGFAVDELLPALVDADARQWLAYVVGTQSPQTMLPSIEALAARDPELYFAVTVLWKIMASWVFDLEEY